VTDIAAGGIVVPGVVLALDLGERRIGVAVSDRRRILASPLTVVNRRGDRALEHAAIRQLVEECDATLVVVGLPLSLSGKTGPAATRALHEIAELEAVLSVPVVAHDERLSTVEATRRLRDAQPSKKNPRSPTVKKRAIVDDKAAAILLESFLAADVTR
jgi:putative Holliday junction resolvase